MIARPEIDQAELWLGELKKMAPRSLDVLMREARVLDLRNRKPELLALLLARGRESPDELAAVAELLDQFGLASEAETAYKAFAARDPAQSERSLPLAAFLARHDRPKEAIALLDQASKTCRPEAVAATALPLYVAKSADHEVRRRVETWVAEAIQKSPAAAGWLRTKLANIYCMEERYDEAEALYRRALAGDPNNIETLTNLAWELALRDPTNPRKALDLVNRAIKRAGRTTELVSTRAVALIKAGDVNQAVDELRTAQASDPKDPGLALHLAWAYEQKGKTDLAKKAFAQAEEHGLSPEKTGPFERGVIDRLRKKLTGGDTTLSNPLSREPRGKPGRNTEQDKLAGDGC